MFVKQRRAWASLVPRSVSYIHETSHDHQEYFSQEKRRIAETSGEVLSVCESGDVNASEVDVHQNPRGLHRLHEDLHGE